VILPAISPSVHALPEWLVKRWINRFGPSNTIRICQWNNEVPPITIRCNSLKTNRDRLADELATVSQHVALTKFSPEGIRLSHPEMAINDFESFKLGRFQVQDEAAQIVTDLLDPQPGETILDACAGLGGKTGHMAQKMKNSGAITALDTELHKLESLQKEMDRLGVTIVTTRMADICKMTIKDFDRYFDRVLIDAPCSGLGVIRRNPDTKWQRSKKEVLRLAAIQKKILNAAANLVKRGGTLVYAVCSCEVEENEMVIDTFLKKRKDFSIDPKPLSDAYSMLKSSDGYLRTYPGKNRNYAEIEGEMDGFFAARLIRTPKM
jgi:16S rRNA (cytosine967-C5)-methyltransferase